MAEIALTAVINKATDAAGRLAVQEGSRWFWLQEDISWIQREMRKIRADLKDADANQVGSAGMANLINDIRELAFDVEDILETFLPLMASHQRRYGILGFLKRAAHIFSYGYTARNFSMEIRKIRRRVGDIDRSIFQNSASEKDTWDPRRPVPHGDEPFITGLDRDIEELKTKMLDEGMKFDVIAIVGMPGLGKTTLAKKVFKSTEYQFQCSALVYVSQQPNVREVLQDIARQVGLEKEKREENLEGNLFEFLSQKRYMIMFDDIWHTDAWHALRNSVPINFETGSRVILTSRNSGVGRYIGGERSLHELRPLDPENSWNLFSKMVTGPLGNSNATSCVPLDLEEIGWEIVKRCRGVPLAIVVTTGILRQREMSKHRWSEVLNSMGAHQDAEITSTLVLSYRDLPIELKPCFLYFGLFPEDHEIFALDVINLWVAEKFVSVVGDLTLEEVGEAYLNNLVARNLIQVVRRKYNGRIQSCRIHDLLHNLSITVANEINFFNTHPATSVRRLTRHSGGINSEYISIDHQTPKLRAFLYFDNYATVKRLKIFSSSVRFLRVLYVEVSTFESSIPNDIGNLIHLSYLGIGSRYDWNHKIKVPGTISNLKSLLTLDLKQFSGVIYLPSCILKMKHLRHIILCPKHYFYDSNPIIRACKEIGKNLFPVEVSLPNVQTLYLLNGFEFMPHRLRKLTSLRKLRVGCFTREMVEVFSGARPISHMLEELSLIALDNSPAKFDLSRYQNLWKLSLIRGIWKVNEAASTFPPNLTKLSFKFVELEEDVMENLKNLPNLKYLKICMSYKGKRLTNCSGAANQQHNFPQLEVLKLVNLDSLEELIVEEGGMPRLKTFTIESCPNLRVLHERLRNMMIVERSKYGDKVVIALVVHKKSATKAMKIAVTVSGVESVALAGEEKDQIEIIGEGIDTVGLTRLLRKKVGDVQILNIRKYNASIEGLRHVQVFQDYTYNKC